MSVARDLLKALVDALDATYWSSWQSTAQFWPALEAARSGLDEPETAGDVRRHVICVCPDCAHRSEFPKVHDKWIYEYAGDIFVVFDPTTDGAHIMGAERLLSEARILLSRAGE